MKMTTRVAIEQGMIAVGHLRNEAQELREQVGHPRQGPLALRAVQLDVQADAVRHLVELAKGTGW